jgi:hypothetical protein
VKYNNTTSSKVCKLIVAPALMLDAVVKKCSSAVLVVNYYTVVVVYCRSVFFSLHSNFSFVLRVLAQVMGSSTIAMTRTFLVMKMLRQG